jgi:hypothetical protein
MKYTGIDGQVSIEYSGRIPYLRMNSDKNL